MAVRKGNQEGTDFGRKCLMSKFHPETGQWRELLFLPVMMSPQTWAALFCLLIVLDFRVPV